MWITGFLPGYNLTFKKEALLKMFEYSWSRINSDTFMRFSQLHYLLFLVQDGICDDKNNNKLCNFDGGDCCPHGEKFNSFHWCTDCDCKQPSVKPLPVLTDDWVRLFMT